MVTNLHYLGVSPDTKYYNAIHNSGHNCYLISFDVILICLSYSALFCFALSFLPSFLLTQFNTAAGHIRISFSLCTSCRSLPIISIPRNHQQITNKKVKPTNPIPIHPHMHSSHPNPLKHLQFIDIWIRSPIPSAYQTTKMQYRYRYPYPPIQKHHKINSKHGQHTLKHPYTF